MRPDVALLTSRCWKTYVLDVVTAASGRIFRPIVRKKQTQANPLCLRLFFQFLYVLMFQIQAVQLFQERTHFIVYQLHETMGLMITDDMGNTMIDPASVTDSVLTMVWSLFSLFPAVIAFLLMVLSWKFPIKK